MKMISIVGQGYVGLPLSLVIASSGFKVCGIEIDEVKSNELNDGETKIEGIELNLLKSLIKSQNLCFSQEFDNISNSDVILICVPTPLDQNNKPDLRALTSATRKIGEKLIKGTLVILESTVAPGTTRSLVSKILMEESGLASGEFYLAFSPERIDPLNKKWNLVNTPKLVAGLDKASYTKAFNFYKNFVNEVHECNSLEEAETAKLLENSFRLVNISLVNELASFCRVSNIDITSVIKAAATKPYGFMPFYPSIGVGGHCIPVDPIYLAEKANNIGVPIQMIETAVKVNNSMPDYFVKKSAEKLSSLMGKKILVVGVAYKPNVSDVRESQAVSLILRLRDEGALVSWHDEIVKTWNGEKSVALTNDYDLAIIATPHDHLRLEMLGGVMQLNTGGSI
jgi:UDP-N-acetyl-D-glucosamine dehydrogenase